MTFKQAWNSLLAVCLGLLIYLTMLSQLRPSGWMFINYELGKMWKEVAMPYFKAGLLSMHFSGKTE
jgi:hypothetical protein